MTRLGFVGVGKHAQRMAAAFRECGAEIVAYDRGTDDRCLHADFGFGRREKWQTMPLRRDIDAIVCCAPPDVAAQVTRACVVAGKRCCATKPLLVDFDDHELQWVADTDDSMLYVDLWRLYSPAWLALKADLKGREIRSVHVDFYGNGPVRTTHSGLLDYGPHALAFVLDLGLKPELAWEHRGELGWRNSDRQSAWRYWFGASKQVHVCTGNEAEAPEMTVLVCTDAGDFRWSEQEQRQSYGRSGVSGKRNGSELTCDRDLALRNFCRAFLAGEPSDTLRISCEAMRMLQQAERVASDPLREASAVP